MDKQQQFTSQIQTAYTFKGTSMQLGGAMLDNQVVKDAPVSIPLRMMNRHGLIAGATGSGKTKTLQVLAEQLSANSIPVLLMDIKGDLSGIAAPAGGNTKITERHQLINIPYTHSSSPVEFLTLSQEKGARLRATVSEFGPVLFSKILDLNDVQSGVIAVAFKYCDDNQLPLLDLKDIKKVLQFLSNEGAQQTTDDYGKISTATVGTIIRKIMELEQQGAELFFGERSFEVDDLCRLNEDGKGMVSIIRLTDIQDRPKLFSSFMLSLLAEIYATFPEEGDLDAPKLVVFIDEAHLLFSQASQALLDQIEAIVKLIRSKGVGIFFCTQNPTDIPNAVLSQLGLKIQHALRAFTAKDRKDIKLAAQNYPESEFYDIEQMLTQLGIGEAFITTLNEKGIPTPLVHTMLRAPQSRMDILSEVEINDILSRSALVRKYNQDIDRESAYEILKEKITEMQSAEQQAELQKQQQKATKSSAKEEKSTVEKVMDSTLVKQLGRSVVQEVTRGILGVFGLGGRSRRKGLF